jgi:hypothetical protein
LAGNGVDSAKDDGRWGGGTPVEVSIQDGSSAVASFASFASASHQRPARTSSVGGLMATNRIKSFGGAPTTLIAALNSIAVLVAVSKSDNSRHTSGELHFTPSTALRTSASAASSLVLTVAIWASISSRARRVADNFSSVASKCARA